MSNLDMHTSTPSLPEHATLTEPNLTSFSLFCWLLDSALKTALHRSHWILHNRLPRTGCPSSARASTTAIDRPAEAHRFSPALARTPSPSSSPPREYTYPRMDAVQPLPSSLAHWRAGNGPSCKRLDEGNEYAVWFRWSTFLPLGTIFRSSRPGCFP